MAIDEIHVLDIGTVFNITIKDGNSVIDISSATIKEIHFGKPNGELLIGTAEFITDGTDGLIKYTTLADDLDIDGNWHLQAYIVMSTGSWKSDISNFQVHKNLR